MTAGWIDSLARLWPWRVDPDPELARALGFLGADTEAETVARAGYTCAVAAGGLFGVALASVGAVPAVATGAATALGTIHAAQRGPVAVASLRRTRALGAAAALVGRAVLRLRIDPTTERAARFAARNGEGPLARSLGEHARRAEGTPRSGFEGFACEWADWFPELERTAGLLAASTAASEEDRERTLDRALESVREGARDRVAGFADTVQGPVTAVYAFGVLVPLALVGMLPAARAAGIRVAPVHVAVVYDLALPLALLGAGGWLLVRRPVAFPPPRIPADHPDAPDRGWVAGLAGISVGGAAWVAAAALVAPWSSPIAAVGLGVGTALVARTRRIKQVRDRVREAEANLGDAAYLIGRRVSEGVAVEAALETAAAETAGTTGELLAEAVEVRRRLGVGVRASFTGDHGALADLPSPRWQSVADLVALAATEGRPAGQALLATADQLGELRRIEADARRDLARVTDTLANTGAVFGPLVAGATVALAAGIAGRPENPLGGTLSVPALGTAIGAYVLVLSAILVGMATGLNRGLDRALVGYRIGVGLLAATVTYLAAFVGGTLLL